MPSRRTLKVAQAIRQIVSMAILTEIKDPRVRDVTVTAVEVTPDLRQARVFVSVMGDEAKAKLTVHGLQSAAGFLQSKIAERVDTRYTPRLTFVIDQGVKRSIEVQKMLREVLPQELAEPPRGWGETSPDDNIRAANLHTENLGAENLGAENIGTER